MAKHQGAKLPSPNGSIFPTAKEKLDPELDELFKTSAGPVRPSEISTRLKRGRVAEPGPEQSTNGHLEDDQASELQTAPTKRSRKRRRTEIDDDLEEEAMKRIAGTSESTASDSEDESASSNESDDSTPSEPSPASESGDGAATGPIPQHESLTNPITPSDLDKAGRTVFLGNVCTSAITSKTARKTLERHLTSFVLPSTTTSTASTPTSATPPAPRLESLRFRSTAYTTALPKRASYARRDLHAATTPSTHAYAVYATRAAAGLAARHLNATMVLGRHLRVDCVAHPLAQVPRRCVFVGNLDFVDDDKGVREEARERAGKKAGRARERERPPADVEEGLWREFGKAGEVQSVRVVRDGRTRVGKGFAYVQFTDENAVEAALLFDGKKFPPMLPRRLRVMRAKAIKKRAERPRQSEREEASGMVDRSMQGRASKLLGRAGAAQIRKGGGSKPVGRDPTRAHGNGEPPLEGKGEEGQAVVFEGHRAKANDRVVGLKVGRKGKRKGKPSTRSTKRAAAWRKTQEAKP